MSLEGKVALITGAGRGIGPGIARVLAEKGMIVAVNARSESAEQTAAELRALGLQATAFVADVSRKTEVETMIERIEGELGPLWLLVNNAGLLRAAPTVDLREEDWDDVFAVDAKGVFLCAQAAIRRMMPRGAGRIVNIASIAGKEGNPKMGPYSASKAAVIALTKSLSKELVGKGDICVNSISPAVIQTPILDQLSQEQINMMLSKIPLGRTGKPEEVAALVHFLSSSECSFTTGQCYDISGGRATY